MHFSKIFTILLIPILFFSTSCIQQSEETVIGYSALRISLPVFVAQEQGYFAEEGLDVKLERFDTAQPLMQALVAGTIDVGGYTALPITYNSMLRSGKELYFLTSMMEDQEHIISYFLIQAESDMTLEDLKGKSIGVLPTVAYQKWLEVILENNGLSTEDVTIVPIAPTLQPSALQSGQVEALFTNDPAATTAIQNGIAKKISSEVLVPKYLGEPFIFGSFNIEKEFADSNPETTEKIIRALDRAVAFVNQNPEQSKLLMESYVHESQSEFVQFYPDALYKNSEMSLESEFQSIAQQYAEIGITGEEISVEGLVK